MLANPSSDMACKFPMSDIVSSRDMENVGFEVWNVQSIAVNPRLLRIDDKADEIRLIARTT